jgi:hypothetical protein
MTEPDFDTAFVNANQGAFNSFWNAMSCLQNRESLRSLAAFCVGAKLYKEGDSWCCLFGDNIQEGCCGFGETPYKAALAFENAFYGTVP